MDEKSPLPPGQREISEFPRFGLSQFAGYLPQVPDQLMLDLSGDVKHPGSVTAEGLTVLRRVEQVSNFHCVTTWSRRSLHWGGYRFRDFYEHVLRPRVQPEPNARFVVFRCLDGYVASLPLDDVLAEDVLLAVTLEGEPLTLKHGAPLRIVAPDHYGYKNPKHLCGIEVWHDDRTYRIPSFRRFMIHPRARVAYEERGRGIPGWVLGYVYRPFVRPTIREFERTPGALAEGSARGETPRDSW